MVLAEDDVATVCAGGFGTLFDDELLLLLVLVVVAAAMSKYGLRIKLRTNMNAKY